MTHPTRSLLAAALSASLALAQGGLTAYPPAVTLDSGLDAHRLVVVSSDLGPRAPRLRLARRRARAKALAPGPAPGLEFARAERDG